LANNISPLKALGAIYFALIGNMQKSISNSGTFLLMIAPPAGGKTRLVLELYPSILRKVIFISPLRALANELMDKLSKMPNVYQLKTRKDFRELSLHEQESFFLIATAELIDEKVLSLAEHLANEVVVVFDEFHLFYLWGESFRPILPEICHGVANTGCSIMGLTATMTDELMKKWQSDFAVGMSELRLLDLGNLRLKKMPKAHLWTPRFTGRAMIKRLILYRLLSKGRLESGKTIIFCKYRKEVLDWIDYCRGIGVRALGCIGGEVDDFSLRMKKEEFDFIFATSTLGHGVNLPEISEVVISYRVNDISLWIQMVGRGGRNGGEYGLLSIDSFFLNWKQQLLKLIWISFIDCYIKIYLFIFEPDAPTG